MMPRGKGKKQQLYAIIAAQGEKIRRGAGEETTRLATRGLYGCVGVLIQNRKNKKVQSLIHADIGMDLSDLKDEIWHVGQGDEVNITIVRREDHRPPLYGEKMTEAITQYLHHINNEKVTTLACIPKGEIRIRNIQQENAINGEFYVNNDGSIENLDEDVITLDEGEDFKRRNDARLLSAALNFEQVIWMGPHQINWKTKGKKPTLAYDKGEWTGKKFQLSYSLIHTMGKFSNRASLTSYYERMESEFDLKIAPRKDYSDEVKEEMRAELHAVRDSIKFDTNFIPLATNYTKDVMRREPSTTFLAPTASLATRSFASLASAVTSKPPSNDNEGDLQPLITSTSRRSSGSSGRS